MLGLKLNVLPCAAGLSSVTDVQARSRERKTWDFPAKGLAVDCCKLQCLLQTSWSLIAVLANILDLKS